jgi:hypothetical protein
MHPAASAASCSGAVIDAHTIQRKGPLHRIVDDANHVCRLEPSREGIKLEEIGWREASTFPGYCSRHDAQAFEPIEQHVFTGAHEQCVLQAYRALCNELYRKIALRDSLRYQRDVLDRGRSLDDQISIQLGLSISISGATKSIGEFEVLRTEFERAVREGRFDHFRSRCYFFQGDLCVASTSALHAEFDFAGNKLVDLWDFEVDGEGLMHSTMSVEGGGAISFVWLADQRTPETVVESFDRFPDTDKGDVFVQYCFLNAENTYFSRAWWNSLDAQRQEQVSKYAGTFHYDGGAFVPNEKRLVDWKVKC